MRARPPPRALPAPLCLRPPAAPPEPPVQLWELAEPVLGAELGPDVLRWCPSPVVDLARATIAREWADREAAAYFDRLPEALRALAGGAKGLS